MNSLSVPTLLGAAALVSLLGGTCVQAADRPQCTVKDLTKDCEAFKSFGNKPRIQLPDGSSFPNPLVQSDPEIASRDPEAVGELAEDGFDDIEPSPVVAADLRLQMKMSKVWQSLPAGKKVSPRFAADFSQIIPIPEKLINWAGKKTVYPPGTRPPEGAANESQLAIFWPPTQANPQRRNVSVDEVVRFLNSLPDDSKSALKAVVLERAALKVEMINANLAAAASIKPRNLQAIFKDTRQLLLDEILKGRSVKGLDPDETSAYAKVASVRLMQPDPKAPFCQGGAPGAYYEPITHSLAVCPGLMGFPVAALVKVLGHEMSHSFDPCMQTFQLLKLNKKGLSKFSVRNPQGWPEAVRKNPDLTFAMGTSLEVLEKGGSYTNANFTLMMKNPGAVDELIKMGFLELAAISIPDGEGPTREAYSCLRDKGGFKEIGEKAFSAVAGQMETKRSEAVGAKNEKFASSVKEKMKGHSQCLQIPGHAGHMCEAMCDAWGTKVFGRYLEKNPPKNAIEKLAALSWDFSTACSEKKMAGSVNDASEFNLTKIGEVMTSDTHPTTRRRTDKIILTDARVQAAIGCEPDPKMDCLTKIGTTNSSSRVTRPALKSGSQNKSVK